MTNRGKTNHDYVYIFQKPKKKQMICGDAYLFLETNDYMLIAIADGLGSGREARKAANQAIESLDQFHHLDVNEQLQECNKRLLGTRGAVLSLLKIEYKKQQMMYTGLGNIRLLLFQENKETMIRPYTKPGYLNGRPIQFRQERLQFHKGTLFIMFSDGLEINSTIIQMIRHKSKPDLWKKKIEEDLNTVNDDITCIVGEI